MQDRIPTSGQEGRVLITPEIGGAPYYAKIEMADNPTQEGTPLTKSTLLQDITCDTIGIPRTSNPNEAFLALGLGVGRYGYVITVLFPDGSPVVGATITGGTTPAGETPITNTSGIATVVSTSQSISVTVKSPYLDISDSEELSIQSAGALTPLAVTLQPTGEREFSESFSGKTSPYLVTFDLCAVGAGGGAGGASGTNSDISTNKPGGGGGYVENLLSVQSVADQVLSGVIGAGGNRGTTTAGSPGGSTSVSYKGDVVLTAAGGRGGSVQPARGSAAAGGVGNGNGGSGSSNAGVGTNGGDGAGYKFNDSSLGVAGGGGGGGGRAQGGSPYGGDGSTNASPAPTPGPGGGGGGGSNNANNSYGAAGGNGIVYFRPHYKGGAA